VELPIKLCPTCHTKNEIEFTVCKNCGTSLDDAKYTTTEFHNFKVNYSDRSRDFHVEEKIVPANGIAIYFAETTKPYVILTDKEFVIGRMVIPTSETILDLSDFDAFRMGLSRRHAMIRQAESGYEVIDLSSTNGTWLNDERLSPYTPYPLPSGSRLLLSRIRLVVLYRAPDKSQA
jgi:hypothetical protein